jgi:hypothetical protein
MIRDALRHELALTEYQIAICRFSVVNQELTTAANVATCKYYLQVRMKEKNETSL